MDDTPLFGALHGADDELVTELFSPEALALSPGVAVKSEPDDLPVLADAYLGAAEPEEPLLRALSPPPGADVPAALLGDFPGLSELCADDDTAPPPLPPPPPAYSVHVPSALLPLGSGVRVIPVEIKETGGTVTSNSPDDAAFQNPLAQESCCKFPSSQEAEEASGCSQKKDSSPMVICQLKGGTQMLCIDNSGARELKALHLVPQYQDQHRYPQSGDSVPCSWMASSKAAAAESFAIVAEVHKPMTTLVGRFLPVPAKLNLITQQLDNGTLPAVVNGPAFPSGPALPGPPKIPVAGYCECFTSGDTCTNCNYSHCCNSLRHELERFKAIKACLGRNPEAFQTKIGKGRPGDMKLQHNKGCACKQSGCLKNYCECFEAKIVCSSICKCIGCKNYEESPDRKKLMNTLSYTEIGDFEGSHHLSPSKCFGPPRFWKDRQSTSCISWEVVEAMCACLLAQGEEAEQEHFSQCLAEQMILEEFGRCLSQILHTEFKSKGLKIE